MIDLRVVCRHISSLPTPAPSNTKMGGGGRPLAQRLLAKLGVDVYVDHDHDRAHVEAVAMLPTQNILLGCATYAAGRTLSVGSRSTRTES